MKLFLQATILWAATTTVGLSAPQATFVNGGILTSPTNINAIHFVNDGVVSFSVVGSFTNFTGSTLSITSGKLFNTLNTRFYTNIGQMAGEPGFRFDLENGSGSHPATSFYNSGFVNAQDFPTIVDDGILGVPGGGFVTYPTGGKPIASQLVINAANVVNRGTLSVGNVGALNIKGTKVDLSYGIMTAGTLSESDTNTTFLDTLSAEQIVLPAPGAGFYTANSPVIYDLAWGVTNGLKYDISTFISGDATHFFLNLPPTPTMTRDGFGATQFDLARSLTPFAYKYTIGSPTNIYYNVAFVNTNFSDRDISVNVGFANTDDLGFNLIPVDPGMTQVGDVNGANVVVQFMQNVTDVVTGNSVVNSIYLEDDGATANPFRLAQNVAYTANYSRPDVFEVTTAVPDTLVTFNLVPANSTLDTSLFWNAAEFGPSPATVYLTNAIYEAEIGRDPESLTGTFSGINTLGTTVSDIPDMTNDAGRISIQATHLNLSNARLRAEGLVAINSASTVGTPQAVDWGTANLSLGSLTNSLVVSNMVPTTYKRLRGNISVFCTDWVNIQTNATATNTIHYHVLFVNQDFRGTFTPTVRSLLLKSTNAIVEDKITVIQSAQLNTRSLTLDNTLNGTGLAANIAPAAVPNLRNLLITPKGSWVLDGFLDLGFNTRRPVTSPIGRVYSVLSITNQGLISATSPTLQARTIENDGSIEAQNGGSVILAANTLGLGLGGGANTITSAGTVTLSANVLDVTNSTITANVLNLTAVKQLSDFVAGTVGTNVVNGVSVLVNSWTVTNQLTLTRKPTTGDLYGTELRIIAQDGPPTVVTWSAKDEGDSLGGFINNAVIGHLILDRVTNSAVMLFNAVGKKKAMYVNYLELDTNSASYTDYQHGLFIDPNLTIYFAAANVPADKLTSLFPQLVFAANAVAEARAQVGPQRSLGVMSTMLSATGASILLPPAQGVYSGLFAPVTGVTANNSGFFTFTLAANGILSGRIQMGASSLPFTTKLDGTGSAALTVGGLMLHCTTFASGEVVGEVSNGTWVSALNGTLSPIWTTAQSAPEAGHYKLLLPGSADAGPTANSFGTVTVSAQGVVTVSGQLADGAVFSQSSRVSQDGQWPFYAYAPNGKDVLVGWLNFSEDHGGLSGSVSWLRPAQAGSQYPAGFAVSVEAVGTAEAVVTPGPGVTSQ